jgi:hypothetical protein
MCAAFSVLLAHASQPSADHLDAQLERALFGIQTANRYELASRVQVLADLVKNHDVLTLLLAMYERTPSGDYERRSFLLGIIGELQDERALGHLVKVIAAALPPRNSEPDTLGPRAQEELVRVTAVDALGYLRSSKSRVQLLAIALNHESYFVRTEAVASYVWNSRDQQAVAREFIQTLPESLRPVVTMPRFHRDMDRPEFDRRLAEWRKQWVPQED